MSDTVKSRWNRLSAIAPWRSRGADWRDWLATADLPVQARDLIGRVIRRTRLWPEEKVELTDELISHFADGFTAGESLAALLENFGDERLAARLMTRAARRKRNPAIRAVAATWTAIRWTLGVALALFTFTAIFYIVPTIIFVTGEPSPKVDYAKVINAPALKIPIAQRAWPMYRDAAVQMQLSNALLSMLFAHPGQANWNSARQWLTDHAGDLDLVRRASQKKVLGFIYEDDGNMNSADDMPLWPEGSDVADALLNPDYRYYPLIYQQPLPDIGVLSQLSGCLAADADLAIIQNQPSRCAANLIAIYNIADHIQQQGGRTAMHVARNLRMYAACQLQCILRDDRKILGESELVSLSDRIAGPQVAADFFQWPMAQFAFLDLLQNIYTDNGRGDGHPTASGFRRLAPLLNFPSGRDSTSWQEYLYYPLAILIAPSRRQEIALADQLNRQIAKNMHLPMRQTNWKPYQELLQKLGRDGILTAGVLAILWVDEDMPLIQTKYETYLAVRDGALVAIALERYRRAHGNYPTTLAALIPEYLSSIPADRITGDPPKYRLIQGKPVVYSVGADRQDNGGATINVDASNPKSSQWDSAAWDVIPPTSDRGERAGGDWLLFPAIYIDDFQERGANKFMAGWPHGPAYERH